MFQATLGPSSNQELFHKGLKMLRVGEEIMQVTPPKKVFGEGHMTSQAVPGKDGEHGHSQ